VSHVALFLHSSDFDRFIFQSANSEFYPVFIGGDAWGPNRRVLQEVRGNKELDAHFIGYRTTYWGPPDLTPEARVFGAKYNSIYHAAPDEWAAVSYDAAMAVFSALIQCKNPGDPLELREHLSKMNIPAVTTSFLQFGPNHFAAKEFYIYRIDSSGASFYGTVP